MLTPQQIIHDLEAVLRELEPLRQQMGAIMQSADDDPEALQEAEDAIEQFGKDMARRSYLISVYRAVVSSLVAAGGQFTAELFDESSRHTLLSIQTEELPEVSDAEDLIATLTGWGLDRLFAETRTYIENAIELQTSKLIFIEE